MVGSPTIAQNEAAGRRLSIGRDCSHVRLIRCFLESFSQPIEFLMAPGCFDDNLQRWIGAAPPESASFTWRWNLRQLALWGESWR
jgi:hypothetical protein